VPDEPRFNDEPELPLPLRVTLTETDFDPLADPRK